jgi:hypothetical protein
MNCTCGDTKRHSIASRRTSDGVAVVLWSDGSMTGNLGALPGLPAVRPRSSAEALRAGWLLLGEVELYERGELADLYAACRWTAQRDGLPGTVRARLHRAPRLNPAWTLIETDRDGRPVERFWRLPRMRWPGLAVWNRVNTTEPYELMDIISKFRNLEQLSRHLQETSHLNARAA